jgi:putative ABC transport system ATP-binding protein
LINDSDLADEPTGNLDIESAENIRRIFEGIHKSGKLLIIVTHDHNLLENADRVLKIRYGEIMSE